MNFEHAQTTEWHSWPSTTDMTLSDTYPVHVNFKASAVTQVVCKQLVDVEAA